MSFLSDEQGTESSAGREGIELVTPAVTYRIATGTRDININGATFRASPAAREEVKITASSSETDVVIRLPLKHAFPQRYLAQGVPPRRCTIVIWRKQLVSGEFETIWRGVVSSLAVDGEVAMLRVVDSLGDGITRRLPTVTVGRLCPYVLYDQDCTVNRAAFTIAATVTDVDGRTVKVGSLLGQPDDWATRGALVHVASGEDMPIQSQIGTTITMQRALFELKVGDAVQVSAGCSYTPSDCRFKFQNMPNYGGHPDMATANPFEGNGIGIAVDDVS